jgi:O-glycosyl hydrolase
MRRLFWAALGLVLFLPAGYAAGQEASQAVVTAAGAQVVRGWGVSLIWDANLLYGSPMVASKVPNPAEQSLYMDMLFGDPGRGLGLNVARYNIGGGDNPNAGRCVRPQRNGLRPEAVVQGFLVGQEGIYDWSRDAAQRRMLHEAKARGANIFEAFSNSAPWWMTVSGCVSGAEHAAEDNLRANAVPAFAQYLARVAAHFRRAEGMNFESVSPVNEPDGLWWVVGNNQEGSYASVPIQAALITALGRDLAGTGTIVSADEANNFDNMTQTLGQMDAPTLAALGRVNVHQYNGTNPAALHQRVTALGKKLWASEVGCCLEPNRSEIYGGLYMAQAIQNAFTQLGAEVWCFWQAGWGVINIDSGHPVPLKQFYTIGQYTRFIRPGFRVLVSRGNGVLAAISPDGRRVVLVSINWQDHEVPVDFDVLALRRAGANVVVYRTTPSPRENWARGVGRVDATGHLVDRQPGQSVSTYVIDGGVGVR